MRVINATDDRCASASAGDVVQEPGLLGGGAASFGFDLKRHELGQAVHAAVTDQVAGSDAQAGVQGPGVADHHVTRAEGVGDGAEVAGGDARGLACPAGADVVPEESDGAGAVGHEDPLLDMGFHKAVLRIRVWIRAVLPAGSATPVD